MLMFTSKLEDMNYYSTISNECLYSNTLRSIFSGPICAYLVFSFVVVMRIEILTHVFSWFFFYWQSHLWEIYKIYRAVMVTLCNMICYIVQFEIKFSYFIWGLSQKYSIDDVFTKHIKLLFSSFVEIKIFEVPKIHNHNDLRLIIFEMIYSDLFLLIVLI